MNIKNLLHLWGQNLWTVLAIMFFVSITAPVSTSVAQTENEAVSFTFTNGEYGLSLATISQGEVDSQTLVPQVFDDEGFPTFGVESSEMSPDGQFVAFSASYWVESAQMTACDIRLVEISTGEVTTLISGEAEVMCYGRPAWSEDGTQLAVTRRVWFNRENPSDSTYQVLRYSFESGTLRLWREDNHDNHQGEALRLLWVDGYLFEEWTAWGDPHLWSQGQVYTEHVWDDPTPPLNCPGSDGFVEHPVGRLTVEYYDQPDLNWVFCSEEILARPTSFQNYLVVTETSMVTQSTTDGSYSITTETYRQLVFTFDGQYLGAVDGQNLSWVR